jgi:hypothetical protein
LAKTIQEKLKPREKKEKGYLRLSSVGKPDRQLWYEVNEPQSGEKLHPNAYMKFLLGDIVEEIVLFLAVITGHKVTARQKEVKLNGVTGHTDAIIDGTLGDVKSASPFSFEKFEKGLTPEADPFGYREQLQGYLEALQDDDELEDKNRAAFLALHKVTGDMALDIHQKSSVPIRDIIEHKKEMVQREEPPERCYEPVPMGKSGNMKLNTQCSYCSFKNKCWPELRTFLYSSGPVFLTEVAKAPDVPEISKDSKHKKEE